MTRSLRRAQAALGALLTVMLATGCSLLSERTPPAPAGFTTYKGAGFTIAYPQGWTIRQTTDQTGLPVTSIYGPAGTAGFSPQIAIGRGSDQNASFGLLMDTFREGMKAQGYRILSDRPVKLHGARDAQLTELVSSPQQSTRGETAVIRDVHLHVLDRRRVLYDVLVRAPEQDFDAAKLRAALDTFRLR
jgi:hypothetical protein